MNEKNLSTDKDEINNNEKNENKKSIFLTGRVMLVLGVIFVIVSGIVFATTTWLSLNDYFKITLILFSSAFFFGLSYFFEKKVMLDKTGFGFYTIGCVFIPTAVIAAGYYKIFGEWFSLTGKDVYTVLAVTAFTLTLCMLRGLKKYSSVVYAYVLFTAFTAFLLLTGMRLGLRGDIFSFAMSIYSALLCMLENRLKAFNSAFEKMLSTFTISVMFLLSIISIIISGNGIFSFLAIIMFAIMSFYNISGKKNGSLGPYLYSFLMIIGLFRIISPEYEGRFFIISAACLSSVSVLNLSVGLSENVQKAIKICFFILSGIGLFIFGAGFAIVKQWSLLNQLTLLILGGNILWFKLKYSNKFSAILFSVIALIFNAGLVKLLYYGSNDGGAVIFSLLLAAAELIFVLWEKLDLRTVFSDILFLFVSVIAVISGIMQGISHYAVFASCLFSFCIGFLSAVKVKNKTASTIISFILPYILLFNLGWAEAVFKGFNGAFVFFDALMAAASIGLMLFEHKNIYKFKAVSLGFLTSVPVISGFAVLKISDIGLNIFDLDYRLLISLMPAVSKNITAYLFICFFAAASRAVSEYKRKNNSSLWFYASYFSGIAFVLKLVYNIITVITGEKQFSIYALISSLVTVCISSVAFYAVAEKRFNDNFKERIKIAVLFLLNITGFLFAILIHSDNYIFESINNFSGFEAVYLYSAILICILASVISRAADGFEIISGIVLLINMLVYSTNVGSAHIFIAAAALYAVGKALSIEKYIIIKSSDKGFDYFNASSLVLLISKIPFFMSAERYDIWALLMGFISIGIISPGFNKNHNRALLTVGLAFFSFAASLQQFFVIKEVYRLEIMLMPILLFCGEVKLIWREYTEETDWLAFAAALTVIIVLSTDAVKGIYIFDTLFITIGSIIMLFVSHIIKRLKWFGLSSAVLVFLTVYMSFTFWHSSAWWLYLLLAGLVLIALAALNEYNRSKNGAVMAKLRYLLKDWKW